MTPLLLLLSLAAQDRPDMTMAVKQALPAVAVVRVEYKPRDKVCAAICIDGRGYYLTCLHCVSGIGERPILVTPTGLKQVVAKLVASDPSTELALVKIDHDRPLPFVVLAGKVPEQGSPCLVLGHPEEKENTATVGVISALNRELPFPGGRTLKGAIQIDAAVNPGSSGGPLLNSKAELIGVIVALQLASQNIGYAVSAAEIKPFLDKHLPKP